MADVKGSNQPGTTSALHSVQGTDASKERSCGTVDSSKREERGIHAASPSEFFKLLEISPMSDLAALKRRKRRAPAALNQTWSRGNRRLKVLTNRVGLLDCTHFGWGRSSVGRAPQWHCGGQGFESPRLHHLTCSVAGRTKTSSCGFTASTAGSHSRTAALVFPNLPTHNLLLNVQPKMGSRTQWLQRMTTPSLAALTVVSSN